MRNVILGLLAIALLGGAGTVVVQTGGSNGGPVSASTVVGSTSVTAPVITANVVGTVTGQLGVQGGDCTYYFTQNTGSGHMQLTSSPVNCGGGGTALDVPYIFVVSTAFVASINAQGPLAVNSAGFGINYEGASNTLPTVTYVNDAGVSNTEYGIEIGTVSLSGAATISQPLHFSSGTPVCTCDVSTASGFVAVKTCAGASNTLLTVTTASNATETINYVCYGLR